MKNKRPIAIIFSDPHLRDTQPVCRTDDFWETQKKKLSWLKSLINSYGDDVLPICAGDVFHKWKTSPKLLDMALDHLPKRLIAVPGQHDMPGHNYGLINESGYGILAKTEKVWNKVEISRGSIDRGHGKLIFRFFPYGEKLYSVYPETKETHIALVHHFVYKGRKPFPGQLTGVKSLLKKLEGYQLVITGDNHQPFTYKAGEQLLINPGCFTRQHANEANTRPRVYVWYEDNTYDIEYVPIDPSEEVISRKHLEQIEYKNEKIELFVGRLNEDINTQLDFKTNMKNYLEGNPKVKKLTKQKIREAMNEQA